MQTEKKITPQARYDAKATKHYGFKFNLNTDADIINKLESVPNKQGYIKSCIKKMIELEKKGLV